ncbi:Synaptic vesicle protein, partial [Operophtera brumata]
MVVKLDKVPFEDALNMTGFGKFNVVAFMMSSSIIIGMAFEIFSVSYLRQAEDSGAIHDDSFHQRLPGCVLSELDCLELAEILFFRSVTISIPVLPLKFSYYIPLLDIHFNSWRLLDLIFAMPTAFAAIGVACSYESPKYLLSVGQDDEALKVNSVVLDEEGSSSTSVGFWASIKAQTLPMISINPFMVWLPFILDAFMVSVERGSTDVTLCEMIRLARNSTSVVESEACAMNQTAMIMVLGISILIGFLNLLTSSIVNCIGRKALFIGLQLIGGAAALVINASTIWAVSAIFFIVFITGIINFGSLTSFISHGDLPNPDVRSWERSLRHQLAQEPIRQQ